PEGAGRRASGRGVIRGSDGAVALHDDARARLFVVLFPHLVMDDRMPGPVALRRGHVVFPGPTSHSQLLDEIHFETHDRAPENEPLTRTGLGPSIIFAV